MTVANNDFELISAGDLALKILGRRWFASRFEEGSEPYLARLLIGIFLSFEQGVLLPKSAAMKYMKAVDGRTSQRYIGIAERQGLIRVERSQFDKRVDLICPTEQLLNLVKLELIEIARELQSAGARPKFGDTFWGIASPPDALEPFRTLDKAPDSGPQKGSAVTAERLIAQYSETLRFAPDNVAALANRGWLYSRARDHVKALADLDRAIRLKPADSELFEKRALVHVFSAGVAAFERAVIDYTEAIRLDSTNFLYFERRGDLYSELNEQPRAVSDYENAINLASGRMDDDRVAWLLYKRAKCYQHEGNKVLAIADVEAALRLVPGYHAAHQLLGELADDTASLSKNSKK